MSAFSVPVKRLYFPSLHKPPGYLFVSPLLPARFPAAKPSTIAETFRRVLLPCTFAANDRPASLRLLSLRLCSQEVPEAVDTVAARLQDARLCVRTQ